MIGVLRKYENKLQYSDELRSRDINNKIRKIIKYFELFGVDWKEESTLLGVGAFKEVHKTSISNVVMLIFDLDLSSSLKREIDCLKKLGLYNIPHSEYYFYEYIDGLAVAFMKRCYDPNEVKDIGVKVKDMIFDRMIESRLHIEDSQFMVDSNGNPVIIDPIAVCYKESSTRTLTAVYKKQNGSVPIRVKQQYENGKPIGNLISENIS